MWALWSVGLQEAPPHSERSLLRCHPCGPVKAASGYDQPDNMTWSKKKKKTWEGDKPLNRDKNLREGSWAVSGPAGVASVEPLSLKGTTGVGGSGQGKDVTVLLKQYQQGREALVRGRQVWNSLKVGRGGNRPLVSPPQLTQAW